MHFYEEPITIFTVPKAFEGHIGLIQQNAIKSWTQLRPRPQIFLFGNETGLAEISQTLGVTHIPNIQFNEYGTPLLDGIFRQAQELAQNSILTYVNTDIILMNDFLIAVQQLQAASFHQSLMIGKRIDVNITEALDFDRLDWETELRRWVSRKGRFAPVICKDYFVFPKLLYSEIPSFAVGRGHWDSWMIHYAYKLGIPVVDATDVVTAIHQNHDYAHVSGGRYMAYAQGGEVKQNIKLAGGMHLIEGSSATWKLTPSGPKRKLLPPIFSFLADIPRFTKLVIEVFLSKSMFDQVRYSVISKFYEPL